MKDADGEILYVGKAKSLRSRVRSYFSSRQTHPSKTRELVSRVADLDTIVVDSEAEALILENNLIKEHRPRFNINLRDDKTYPYIKVTVDEPFPRVLVTRRLQKDGARYFGPYTDVRRMREALNIVKKVYTVRSCHYRLPREAPARPCLDYHIGRCKAPCVALQSQDDYRSMIAEILEILAGQTRRAAARLRNEMESAAMRLDFERAGELRDAIAQLEQLESRQKVVDIQGGDRDIIAITRDPELACGVILRIRDGKLLGREAVFLENVADEPIQALLSTVSARFYLPRLGDEEEVAPREIVVPLEFPDRPLLERLLSEQSGRRVQVRVPRRGGKRRLLGLAEENARHLLRERSSTSERLEDREWAAIDELQAVLELPTPPRTLVCFDVSHTQGSETVASAVVFEDGRASKSGYRRFRIRADVQNDDFRSIAEAVSRYFTRRIADGATLPELAVIDGGKGQLGAARMSLNELGCFQQPLVALAKREEELFTEFHSEPIRLPRTSAALRLLQRARDEAHRFALTYNRALRTRRTIRSELLDVPGVGAARLRLLLERFGSLRGVASADELEIARLPGFGMALASRVRRHAQQRLQQEPLASAGRSSRSGDSPVSTGYGARSASDSPNHHPTGPDRAGTGSPERVF